ncbi:hypothetical protein GTY83_22955 [Streptomyces sp. SID4928]|nr:hypothetical protein [Streptomyces sp. ACT-1]MYR51954.1 hypothetical protein [Streptomyces sp. SID4928]
MADARIGVKGTGDASADGGVVFVNTGAVTGPVNLHAPRTAVSGYLLQVERMAAADFRGREAELSALAAFGTEARPPGGSGKDYWRWLAPAWAGKSALLAEFVLNPPAGIDVVAFFITSRMAGQNDAAAFCEVVQRQLYALLREEEPLSTPHTRDEQLRLALDRAAERSAAEGRRLVLVVDGLDEDHGVTAGPDCHSIAALLPRTPPHGMRIIVAGRPHPPVPDDVPGDHPLWTTEIDHWLEPSPHAQATRRDAEQDLLRLLDGGGLGRELVSLTVAAGGGLSAHDIAELTGSRPRRVERELSAASGRSFRRRAAHWTPGGPDVYLLAHEEIQRGAADLATDAELADGRTRLHRWAQTYRSAGWPPATPAYLLRGYAQLLRELGDTGRLVELVCDTARHERLWQVTGADLDALSELSASLDQLAAHGRQSGDPDVPAALRLAAARDGLHERARALPPGLIGLWARLGHTDRAVSMAESQRGWSLRSLSLTAVATSLAATGHGERAAVLADDAETPELRDDFLWAIATGLAEAGRYAEAVRTASRVTDTETRAETLVAILKAVAQARARSGPVDPDVVASLPDAAMRAVRRVPDTVVPVELLADLAHAYALLGDDRGAREAAGLAFAAGPDDHVWLRALHLGRLAVKLAGAPGLRERATEAALESVSTVASVDDLRERDAALPEIAAGLAAVGRHEQAAALVDLLRPLPSAFSNGLLSIATAIAESGDPDKALEWADRITEPADRCEAFTAIGRWSVTSADPLRTRGMAQRILDELDGLSDGGTQVNQLIAMADFLSRAGQDEPARAAVVAATDAARGGSAARGHVVTQVAVASALAAAGAEDDAHRLIDLATRTAEAEEPGQLRLTYLLTVAEGLHAMGCDDRRDGLLSALLDENRQDAHNPEHTVSLQRIAETFGATGSPDRAGELARELLDRAANAASPSLRSWIRYRAANAFLAAEDIDAALALTAALPEGEESSFLSGVVRKLLETGAPDRAARLAEELSGAHGDQASLRYVAADLAARGDTAGAVALLDDLSVPALREVATADVVGASARAGAPHEAHALARAITDPGHRSKALAAVARAHGPTAEGRALLVEALALGPWDQLVEAVAAVTPEHLLLLADLSRPQVVSAKSRPALPERRNPARSR